jgi:hypothetical protein
MKLLSMYALLLGTYALVLGVYAWFEHEPFMVVVGIFPVLLFSVARTLDGRFEKREWPWTTTRSRAGAI